MCVVDGRVVCLTDACYPSAVLCCRIRHSPTKAIGAKAEPLAPISSSPQSHPVGGGDTGLPHSHHDQPRSVHRGWEWGAHPTPPTPPELSDSLQLPLAEPASEAAEASATTAALSLTVPAADVLWGGAPPPHTPHSHRHRVVDGGVAAVARAGAAGDGGGPAAARAAVVRGLAALAGRRGRGRRGRSVAYMALDVK